MADPTSRAPSARGSFLILSADGERKSPSMAAGLLMGPAAAPAPPPPHPSESGRIGQRRAARAQPPHFYVGSSDGDGCIHRSPPRAQCASLTTHGPAVMERAQGATTRCYLTRPRREGLFQCAARSAARVRWPGGERRRARGCPARHAAAPPAASYA